MTHFVLSWESFCKTSLVIVLGRDVMGTDENLLSASGGFKNDHNSHLFIPFTVDWDEV